MYFITHPLLWVLTHENESNTYNVYYLHETHIGMSTALKGFNIYPTDSNQFHQTIHTEHEGNKSIIFFIQDDNYYHICKIIDLSPNTMNGFIHYLSMQNQQ